MDFHQFDDKDETTLKKAVNQILKKFNQTSYHGASLAEHVSIYGGFGFFFQEQEHLQVV